jgi:LacI family transcriptional regulator
VATQNLGFGPRTVTLKQVAIAADVHISTASRALDPSKSWRISSPTVERVREAAERLGYTPDMVARGLKRGTTTTIGVIVADLENTFVNPIIRGIAWRLERDGFVSLVAETQDDHDRFVRVLRHLVSRRVDAVVCGAASLRDAPLLRRAVKDGLPVVLVVRGLPRSGLPSVVPDDRLGSRLAVDHLYELGHRVVAQLRGPPDNSNFVARARAFQARVAELGIADATVDETAVEPTVEEGRRVMQLTLDRAAVRPTGVCAQNDLHAIGAVDAVRAAGLACPDDISVVGFNDGPFSDHVSPALTTIRIPGHELGERAAELALELIQGSGRRFPPVELPVDLVVRASTGPPPRPGRS